MFCNSTVFLNLQYQTPVGADAAFTLTLTLTGKNLQQPHYVKYTIPSVIMTYAGQLLTG